MARFDDYFIRSLSERADLFDIVSRYTALSQRSGRFWALCPFHSEKTPSFTVSREMQLYHCFGCGKGGDLYNFIMDIERLDFPEAVEFVANLYNVELPGDDYEHRFTNKSRLLLVNTEAARFFNTCLSAPEGEKARQYIHRRGLSPGIVRRFGLGYAPASWDSLHKHLISKGFTDAEMLEAGLVRKRKSGKGYYDNFRDRLMFPIIDTKGKVIGFGGRTLDPEDKRKYLNTEATPIFSKKDTLYAFNLARKSGSKNLILVEGYMDAVSLHQAGFANTAAALGTALTPEQARMIAKSFPEVVIAFDTDSAGSAAADRAIETLSACSLAVKLLRVPGGKDPDEFIQKNGASEFARILEKADEQMDFRLMRAKSGLDLKTEEDRIKYVNAALELLSSVRSRIDLEVYAGRVADEANITRDIIIKEALALRREKHKKEHKKQHSTDINPDRLIQPPRESGVRYADPANARVEESLISLLSRHFELIPKAEGRVKPEHFTSSELGEIYASLLKKAEENTDNMITALSGELSPTLMGLYSGVLARDLPHLAPEKELEDLLTHIEQRAAPKTDPLLAIRDLKRKMQTNESEDIDGRE